MGWRTQVSEVGQSSQQRGRQPYRRADMNDLLRDGVALGRQVPTGLPRATSGGKRVDSLESLPRQMRARAGGREDPYVVAFLPSQTSPKERWSRWLTIYSKML